MADPANGAAEDGVAEDGAAEDGRLVVGRYRLGRLLGRGGMGSVWAATDEVLGRAVALKELLPSPDLNLEQRELVRKRTMREARAAARISHPAAVTVYDVFEDEGRPWIVMQLLDTESLADVLARRGPLAPAAAAAVGVDLIDALTAAHRAGVLHRDVKPANVMLFENGRAVLTDFGIATVADDPTLTATGLMVGSAEYMSPERARGNRPTAASDVWSLGATLYAAVEGTSPFRRNGQLPTLTAVVSEPAPEAVKAGPLRPVIARLLAKDPAERPGAEEARELLLVAQAEATVELSRPPSTREHEPAPEPTPEPTLEQSPSPEPVSESGPAPEPEPLVPEPKPLMPEPEPLTPEPEPLAPEPEPLTSEPEPLAPEPEPLAPEPEPLAPEPEPLTPEPEPEPEPERPVAAPQPIASHSAALGSPGRRRLVPLAVAAAILALATVIGLIGLLQDGTGTDRAGQDGTDRAAPASTKGALPASPSANSDALQASSSPNPANTKPTTKPAKTAAATADALPANFRTHVDPTGFEVAVPRGWTRSVRGTAVTFRAPHGSSYLLVDTTTKPKADALKDWKNQESSAAKRFPGYHQLRLERVDYRGWNAADWEFTWRPGSGVLHVLNRNIRVNDHRAYALYWSIPESDWTDRKADFATIARTFKPA